MLIVVCGMHRSGSTLTYQLTSQMLDDRIDLRHLSGGLGKTLDDMRSYAASDQVYLAKTHVPTRLFRQALPEVGAKYIYTYRDVRDAIASLWRKGKLPAGHADRGPESAARLVNRELLAGTAFRRMPSLFEARYEDFVADTTDMISSLARFLDVALMPGELERLREETSLERQRDRVKQLAGSERDLSTRITPRHITDARVGAWWHTLTVAEVQAIEHAAEQWLTQHDYRLAISSTAGHPPA